MTITYIDTLMKRYTSNVEHVKFMRKRFKEAFYEMGYDGGINKLRDVNIIMRSKLFVKF